MKRAKIANIAVGCLVMALLATGCAFIEEINKLTIQEIDLSRVPNGIYKGEQINFPVTAKVRVNVDGGRITELVLVEHGHGPDHGADAILPRVLEKQSLLVDAVSGSTYSSRVVLKAIENALAKATN